jgi:hypothetical protein
VNHIPDQEISEALGFIPEGYNFLLHIAQIMKSRIDLHTHMYPARRFQGKKAGSNPYTTCTICLNALMCEPYKPNAMCCFRCQKFGDMQA